MNSIVGAIVSTAFGFLLTLAIPSAWADTSPHIISMDDLPHSDLSSRLIEVASFASPCDGALRFGRNGEIIVVDCGGSLPLGREFHDPSNLNGAGPDFSPGQRRTAHVYDAARGTFLSSFEYTGVDELTSLAGYIGDGSWLAGTEPSGGAGPRVFALSGSSAVRVPLRAIRSQFVAARRIDDSRVALVYEAQTDVARNNRFMEPWVALFNTESGAVLSDVSLDWENGRLSHAIGATVDADGVLLFYRRFEGDQQRGEVFQQRFGFDGVRQGTPIGLGFDAGSVVKASDFLLASAQPHGCENVVAVVLIGLEVRHCFQHPRSHPQNNSLQRQRPTEAEQYGYHAQFMNRGELVAITGRPGVDESARDPHAPTPTHIFETASGRYLGALTVAAATATDAPLVATRVNDRVTIWRLNP